MEFESMQVGAIDGETANPVLDWPEEQVCGAADRELKHLSFLSHDMNNNLSAVALHLGVLRRRLGKSAEFADACEMLQRAQESIDHTMRGMRRLLEYRGLREMPVRDGIGLVNLRDLCAGVVAQLLPSAEAKGVNLEVNVPRDAVVAADGDLLVLALQNLVGNAVKFSDRGTVRVRFRERRRGGDDRWELSVSDEGRGIAPEHVDDIFTTFGRRSGAADSGHGLGLSITVEAARLLGAELSVVSQLGVGSTFRLTPSCKHRRTREHQGEGKNRSRSVELGLINTFA